MTGGAHARHLEFNDPDPAPADGLKHRLVLTGAQLLRSDGLPALTLREIARRAGVSHGAPRRYFPTHLELLSAIAQEGYAQLAAAVRPTPGDGPATSSPPSRGATWPSPGPTPACSS